MNWTDIFFLLLFAGIWVLLMTKVLPRSGGGG